MGLFDAIFGSNDTQTSTQYPAWYTNQMQDNLDTANFLTSNFFGNQPTAAVAGFSPDQLAAQDALRMLVDGQLGKGYGGARAFDIADNFTAPTVTAGQLSGTSLDPYLNPYNSLVRDDALSAIDERQGDTMARLGRQAAAASPFGGSSNALMQAEVLSNFDQERQRTANLMNQQGYYNAQTAAQRDISNDLQSQALNQNAAFQQANTQLNAINQAGTSQSRRLQDALTSLAALTGQGQQQQQLQQQQINVPFDMLSLLSSVTNGTQAPSTQYTEGPDPGLIDRAASVASLFGF